jgi:hypothetical protein
MAAATVELAYRPGYCAWCAQPLERDTSSQEIRLEVLAPAGVVTIHSWLDRSCHRRLPMSVGSAVSWRSASLSGTPPHHRHWPVLATMGHRYDLLC